MSFAGKLLEWFDQEPNRRRFPWREDRTPYRMLVAELMLKRTRAENVAQTYEKFIHIYPTAYSIHGAGAEELENFLRPLGLHRNRASEFKRIADVLITQYRGKVPRDLSDLLALPGVGRYTAHAILCFGFGDAVEIVDVNVRRILGRYFGVGPSVGEADYWTMARHLLPADRVPDYNCALLDLGALICTARKLGCDDCPLTGNCADLKSRENGRKREEMGENGSTG